MAIFSILIYLLLVVAAVSAVAGILYLVGRFVKANCKLIMACMLVVFVTIAGFIILPPAKADEYDFDAEVISIVYVDNIVEFDNGADCFEFEGGAVEHHLGDILHVVMDNMHTPTRKDDIVIESEYIGETLRVETYYIVAVDGVAWGAFLYTEDAEEFVQKLKREGIEALLVIVGAG